MKSLIGLYGITEPLHSYHVTHHLFPSLPYHNLGKAHRRLAHDLSASALYLQTVRNSLWDALRRIWREAAAATR